MNRLRHHRPAALALALAFAGFAASAADAADEPGFAVSGASDGAPQDAALARIELQLTSNEFEDAAADAQRLVRELERANTRYDLALARPLMLLGDARLGSGDGPGALEAYDRALHVVRVNRGLFDPGQVDIVYREAVAHATLGDGATANARHEYAYNVLVREHGTDHPELVPGLFALAECYHAGYNIFPARNLFRRAAEIGQREFPPGDARTIRALRGIAATFRDERFPPVRERRGRASNRPSAASNRQGQFALNDFAPGERALIGVVNLLRDRPDATSVDIAPAMLELADWYLLFDKHGRAVPLYQRVWQLMEEDPQRRHGSFAAPTPLYLPLPLPPAKPEKSPAATPTPGVVELAVTVTERGHVVDMQTLRSHPEGLMDFKVRRAARSARYRPTLTDAGPVRTEDVRVEYNFAHYPTPEKP